MYLLIIEVYIPLFSILSLPYTFSVDLYNLFVATLLFYIIIIPDAKYLKNAIQESDRRELLTLLLAEKLRKDDIQKESETEVAYYNHIMNNHEDDFRF